MSIDIYFKRTNLNDFAKVEKVRGYLVPELENILKKIPGKNGMRFITQRKNMRVFEVDLRLIPKDEKDLWERKRRLVKLLNSNRPEPLAYKGLTYYAILDGTMNFEKNRRFGFVTLKFICPDPYGYGEEKTLTAPSGIAEFKIFNNGDDDTPFVLSAEAKHRDSSVRVTNATTGEMIELTPVSSLKFYIDTEKHYACSNDKISLMKYVNVKSDFFKLVPGENKITIENLTRCDITFKEKFL